MLALWARFAPARRIGVRYDSLSADPDRRTRQAFSLRRFSDSFVKGTEHI